MRALSTDLSGSFSSGLRGLSVLIVVAGMMGLTACQSTEPATQVGLQEEIPSNANRILLHQQATPPADVYVDAINFFQRQDWSVTAREETMDAEELEGLLDQEPLAFTVTKQVNDELALEISAEISRSGTGALLTASSDYASEVSPSQVGWKQSEWTEGRARTAFFETLEILRHTAYDAAEFEYGVAIEKEGSEEARQQA